MTRNTFDAIHRLVQSLLDCLADSIFAIELS